MSDIALVVVQSSSGRPGFDWVMDGSDLESDVGLKTAVEISLFTYRRAADDDVLPDGSTDRRGWWGDNELGSRLWLLAGANGAPETARRAALYSREALQWLIDDKVAQSIDVTTGWITPDTLAIGILIAQQGAQGQKIALQFSFVWSPTLALADSDALIVAPPSGLLLKNGGRLQSQDLRNVIQD